MAKAYEREFGVSLPLKTVQFVHGGRKDAGMRCSMGCSFSLWLLMAVAGLGATARAPRRVLIVNSFGRDVSPWSAITAAFKTELAQQSPVPLEFHEAPLETARDNEPQTEAVFAEYVRALYAQREPDLVALIGGPAAHFWLQHRSGLFPAVPVVIGGMERRPLRALTLTSNDTAVASQRNLSAGIEVVLRLFPATTNMAIVFGNSPVERFWMDECRHAWQPYTNRIRFVWLNELPFQEMCRRVADLPPGSAVGYGALLVDAAGVPHEGWEALDRLCSAANAPVFGMAEEQLGHGIVGGWLVSGATQGREMARTAVRVLRGGSPDGFATPVIGPTPMFDRRVLRRWHTDERRLPAGSVVRFRPPSVWAQYRWQIVGALGIILLQAATILSLLVHRARRRRAEADLRENQQFMELANAAGALGLWVQQVPTGAVRANPRFRAIFGFPTDSAIRFEDVIARIHPDDRSQAEVLLREAVREGRSFEVESRLLLPDGAERWISIKGMAVLDARGQPLRTEGVVIDRTARHVAEMTAKRHRDQLAHVGRVHALGQLSSALAHELNQPLSAILSNAQAAQRFMGGDAPDLEEIRGALQDIVADGSRASDVIRGMRALVQRHRIELSLLDLDGVLRDVAALLHSDAVIRRVTVTLDLDPKLHPVRGDRIQLQQVVLNLVLNALDAMTDSANGDRVVTLRALNVNSQAVRVAVMDRGTGISRDKLDKLFEPFRTTKPQGLGLGLTISRSIIEAHGGRLWGENNADRGATFYFELPVAGKSSP